MIQSSDERHYGVDEVVETVHELIAPRQHRQTYRAGWQRPNRTGPIIRDHTTDQESLLAQLREAIVDRSDTQAGTKAGQAPRTTLPRFSADAFDRMERIRFEVGQWCERLDLPSQGVKNATVIVAYLEVIERIVGNARVMNSGVAQSLSSLHAVALDVRGAIEPDIAQLARTAPALEQLELDDLGGSAGRWATWCRIMTGWQDAALRPRIPCPACGATAGGERQGLRIRIEGASGTGGILTDAALRAGVCLSCNTTWGAGTLGLLAEQLRSARLGLAT